MPNHQHIQNNNATYLLVIIGAFIAAWIQYIQFEQINIDSVIYFEAAKAILHGQWKDAFQIYNWPFYSATIALVSVITNFSIETSAKLLNVLFFSITTWGFLRIIEISGGKNKELILGAIILFSSRHIVGQALQIQIRDEGFWGFYLCAIYFFIRYIKDLNPLHSFAWQILIITSALYRIEGFAYLILLPFSSFFIQSSQNKIRLFFSTNYLLVTLLVCALLIYVFGYKGIYESRLHELDPQYAFQSIFSEVSRRSELYSEILGRYLGQYATAGLLLTFVYVIIIKTINTIGLINLSLLSFNYNKTKLKIEATTWLILISTITISLITQYVICARSFVLVGRYTFSASFILLVITTFSISTIIENKNYSPKRSILILTFLSLFYPYEIYKNIKIDYSNYNSYTRESVLWLKKYNTQHGAVFYDNLLTQYYANIKYDAELRDDINFITAKLQNESPYYRFLVISFGTASKDKIKASLISNLGNKYKELKKFPSDKSDHYVIIYERNYP